MKKALTFLGLSTLAHMWCEGRRPMVYNGRPGMSKGDEKIEKEVFLRPGTVSKKNASDHEHHEDEHDLEEEQEADDEEAFEQEGSLPEKSEEEETEEDDEESEE